MNKRTKVILCAVALALFSFGCAGRHPQAATPGLTSVSTISALLVGDYDGTVSLADLLTYGDTGVGTFQALDGEMVVLDGKVYQVTQDGKVSRPPLSALTPFAGVAPFSPAASAAVDKPLDFEGLAEKALALAANPDVFILVKAEGHFTRMKTRVAPVQQKPYPTLVEATRYQPEFSFTDAEGTIVGIYTPSFAAGIAVPGFHLHFLTDDRKKGGHVLGFSMDKGEISIMPVYKATVLFPQKPFSVGKDMDRDWGHDLKKAEGDTE